MVTDHDRAVCYYEVHKGSPLGLAITCYHETCYDFVRCAESLVDQYKADSATMLYGLFDITLSRLNFMEENVPPDWEMEGSGGFVPKQCTKEFEIKLPYFCYPFSPDVRGVRFGVLGDAVVISVETNKDGSLCRIPDANVLDNDSLKALKAKASAEQLEHFKQLGRSRWMPFPLSTAKVFQPSAEVIKLNAERKNFYFGDNRKLALKHSPLGRRLRRTPVI